MFKKTLIIGIVVVLAAAGGLLMMLSKYDSVSDRAEAIADLAEMRAASYRVAVENGDFDYDREQSVLSKYHLDYQALTSFWVRQRTKEKVEQNLADLETAIERAKQREQEQVEFHKWAEEHQARQVEEIRRNQQRFNQEQEARRAAEAQGQSQ